MPDARALSDHHDGISARLVYTEPMLRRAVWTVMVRRVARGPIGLADGVFVLATLVLYAEGVTDFILGAVIVGLILLAMSIVAIWRAHHATTIGKFRALAGGGALLIATTSDATFRSAEGTATLPWRLFTEVWGIGDCWMLFTAPGQFSTIPMSGLNEDARAFLASRLPPFAMRRPDPPSGRLTELEVLAIAKEAARRTVPDGRRVGRCRLVMNP